MRQIASKPVLAAVFALSLAAALSACGRKGPLEAPAMAPTPPAEVQTG